MKSTRMRMAHGAVPAIALGAPLASDASTNDH
jgi:hypothetical protein